MEPVAFAGVLKERRDAPDIIDTKKFSENVQLSIVHTGGPGVSRSRGSRFAKAGVLVADALTIATAMLVAAVLCSVLGAKPEGSGTLLLVSTLVPNGSGCELHVGVLSDRARRRGGDSVHSAH